MSIRWCVHVLVFVNQQGTASNNNDAADDDASSVDMSLSSWANCEFPSHDFKPDSRLTLIYNLHIFYPLKTRSRVSETRVVCRCTDFIN